MNSLLSPPAAEAIVSDPVLINDWHPVARSDGLAEGQVAPVRLLGQDLVIWRTGGRVAAWQDLCVHRGARLSMGRVKSGCLVCPYHGWEYGIDGQCQRFPSQPDQKPTARASANVHLCKERYGLVWVCIGEPSQDIAVFPEWDDPSYRKIVSGPYPVNASGPRIMENALDLAHVPFVHAGTLGDSSHAEVNAYSVDRVPEGILARNYQVYERDPDGTGIGGTVAYDVLVARPFTLIAAKPTASGRFAIFFTLTPVENKRSIQWFLSATNYAKEISLEEFTRFQDPIMAEDVGIVESQRPELLPLDLHAELHLRCDRITVAYRQWLKALGLRYGTS
jgi:phenylpropionate dioxygenase-like ring-hydroxylating dioxygenase large terminal subunit